MFKNKNELLAITKLLNILHTFQCIVDSKYLICNIPSHVVYTISFITTYKYKVPKCTYNKL